MKAAHPAWVIILPLALIKFIIPFLLIAPEFELQRDEFLYYQQGQHLSFGFLENPPMIALLAQVSSWFGDHEALIRFWPALIGSATLVLTCLVAAELGGRRFAQLIAGFSIITGAFLRVHTLFQPNILDIFSWTLVLYFLLKFMKSMYRPGFLFLAVISFAVGWWSKYSILFLAVSLIVSILLTRHRKILIQKNTYLAIILLVILIIPNIVWQYNHNWPLIHHMQELQETQLRFLSPVDFLKDQFLLLFPVFFIWLAGIYWLARKPELRIFSIVYVFVILLLLFGRAKSYYSLGVYPFLLAAGAVAWQEITFMRKWLQMIIIVVMVGLTVPFIPLLVPVWSPDRMAAFYEKNNVGATGLLKWEDQQDHPLPQDFADMLGWKEISERTENFFAGLPQHVKNSTIIYGRHYGHAGSLQFYTRGDSLARRVISDNGSFLLWIPDSLRFRHLLFIGRQMPGPDDEVFNHFQKRTVIDSVRNPLSRQFGDKIIFFENASDSAILLAQKELQEMKNRFRR